MNEYKVITVHAEHMYYGEKEFNRLSQQGWELISVISTLIDTNTYEKYYLKREKQYQHVHTGAK